MFECVWDCLLCRYLRHYCLVIYVLRVVGFILRLSFSAYPRSEWPVSGYKILRDVGTGFPGRGVIYFPVHLQFHPSVTDALVQYGLYQPAWSATVLLGHVSRSRV